MRQATPDIVTLLRLASERRASDLLLTTGLPPMLHLDGAWQPTEFEPLAANDTRLLMYAMMDEKKQRDFEERRELDFSFMLSGYGRFRVNVFFQRGAVGGVLRTIASEIPSLERLGLPQVVADVVKQPRGLVLVTGPTGSGKSTTLAALIDCINTESRKHIVTIEDPIEFFHPHKRSIISQRELGEDTRSFERALRAVLRQAPDVILVGEMRDFETIGAAVTAAETGHLVMGTLHTNSAAETVDRIIDVFPEKQQAQVRVQLAHNLQAILAQQLVPTIDGGRVLAYEFLVATPAVRNLIREGKTHQIPSAIQMGGQHGMQTMDAHLAELYLQRLISYQAGVARAADPKEFARLVDANRNGPNAGTTAVAARPSGARQTDIQPSASPPTLLGRGGRGG
jgi:twitching motility protein PilT